MNVHKEENEVLIEVNDLEYSYSMGKKALKNINLKVFSKEKVAVVGANGAGKSTLFLALNGIIKPDKGEIRYRGSRIGYARKDIMNLRRKVGIVFQDPDNQIIASTVYKEVSFGPMNLKLGKEEVKKRVEDALEYMEIEEYKDRPPHYLSGGEKKRVAIADILAMKPECILFDEPTASLDPAGTAGLEEILNKISEEGITVILSTHDVEFVYRWADRVLVFSDGECIASGKPEEIFTDEEIVKRARIKKPVFLEILEILNKYGILEQGSSKLRTMEEMENYLRLRDQKKE